jgi:hypothetical protein
MAPKSFLAALQIRDQHSCQRAILLGSIVAMMWGTATGIAGIYGFFIQPPSDEISAGVYDPLSLIDAGLIIAGAVFTYQKSRIAATSLVLLFLFIKISLWFELGVPQTSSGLFVLLLIFLCLVRAMIGTYVWPSYNLHASIKKSHDRAI